MRKLDEVSVTVIISSNIFFLIFPAETTERGDGTVLVHNEKLINYQWLMRITFYSYMNI